MSKRIRYVANRSDTNDTLVSVRVFPLPTGEDVKVYLTSSSGSYSIVNAATGVEMAEGTGVSLSSLKAKAKKKLVSMGYVFEDETRDRSVVENQVPFGRVG